MSSMPKAYSYIRMSTKEQLKGDSTRRQVEKTRAYCKENGLDLVEQFDDYGVSGYTGRNREQGALARFLDAVREGTIAPSSYLIIESMDRLTRQAAMTAMTLLSEIVQAGVTVVTLDDQQTYSAETIHTNQYQLMLALGSMIRAHEESKRKAQLLSDTWDQKRRELRTKGKVLTSQVPAWLAVNKERTAIVLRQERAAIVQEIFELTCNGYGAYSIARLFNERGEPAWGHVRATYKIGGEKRRTPPIWGESYIKKILSNRAVLGEFQPRKVAYDDAGKRRLVSDGDPILDYYPQIIDEASFRAAALAIQRRRTSGRGRKGVAYSNVFTGLLRCDRCNGGMRFIDKGPPPKGGKYLRCSASVSGADCFSSSIKYEPFETLILSALETLDVDKIVGGKSILSRVGEKKQQQELLGIDVEGLERKITRLNEILVGDDGPSPESTLATLRQLEAERRDKMARLKHLENEVLELTTLSPDVKEMAIRKLIEKIRGEADDASRSQMRRALAAELHSLIETIAIRADHRRVDEVMESDPNWRKTYGVRTEPALRRHLESFGFEVSIRFRGGLQKIVSGSDRKELPLKWNRRMQDFKLYARREGEAASG